MNINEGLRLHVLADLNQPWPFKPESFDLVIYTWVLEHLTNSETFVQGVSHPYFCLLGLVDRARYQVHPKRRLDSNGLPLGIHRRRTETPPMRHPLAGQGCCDFHGILSFHYTGD